MNNKRLFILSLIALGYFTLLFLNGYVIKSDFIIIGVIQEITTIPMLLFVLFLFYFSIKFCSENKFSLRKSSFWSFAILTCLVTIIIGSFLK